MLQLDRMVPRVFVCSSVVINISLEDKFRDRRAAEEALDKSSQTRLINANDNNELQPPLSSALSKSR